MRNTTTHVKYLQPWGRYDAVKVDCTCGQSHGLESYRSFEVAMETGRFLGYVAAWVNNPNVSRVCREFAERGTGIESLRQALKL
jgi:hypothetical protein